MLNTTLSSIFQCLWQRDDRYYESNYDNLQRLNEGDDLMISLQVGAIATSTWFEGDPASASKRLKASLTSVLKANPWLAGRIVKYKRRNYLAYNESDPSDDHLGDTFLSVPSRQSSTFMNDPEMETKGADQGWLVHRGGPVFKVTTIPCSKNPRGRFALVVSMSHFVGDGHTYYQIYNMLVGLAPIKPLQVERLTTTPELAKSALGEAESKIPFSFGFYAQFIISIMVAKFLMLFLPSSTKTSTYTVDKDAMAQAKKASSAACGAAFVSTNDVLVTWYMQNSGCKHALMCMNLRDRLDEHHSGLAGNYQHSLYYSIPQDASNPGLIRTSVQQLRRAVSPTPTQAALLHGGFAIITNWVSLSGLEAVNLPNCEELEHKPFGNELISSLGPNISTAMIYRQRAGEIAISVSSGWGPSAATETAPDFCLP